MDYKAQEKRIVVGKLLKYLSSKPQLSRIDFVQHISLFMKNQYQENKGSEFIVASKCYEAIDKTFSKEEIERYLSLIDNPIFKKLINKIPQFISEYENKMCGLRRIA